ncbi:uncharacterized protein SPSK_01702 [Sporothrix schenckii 1099-18]|uniref:Peroxidase n=2 Tax=Sporothrix schenckii TaxID=29908 RepID=U7PL44_SPOS1|nr:uncharacterized protein SPSK_01702 [Sporothrix schenckii 1099-18]ERS95419.1 hypothetical protein HMPREF1624_08297 [Sporothrix schenckii ATCC 58251]KJR87451.1 hypothetical protein SPSK_01702 [Sporothrix schenckii 1099-18]
MHASLFLVALAAVAGPVAAWPGMGPGGHGAAAGHAHHARFHHSDMYKEIRRAAADAETKNAAKTVAVAANNGDDHHEQHKRSVEMLGDLVYLPDDSLSASGKEIKLILAGKMSPHAPLPVNKRESAPEHKQVRRNNPCRPQAPSSTAKSESAPASSSSSSAVPASSEPVSSAPVSSQPVSSPPASSTPVSSAPASSAPASSAPVSSAPLSSALSESSSTQSSSTQSTASPSPIPSPASCDVWSQVAKAIVPTFQDGKNGCSRLARGAIRLGFHDAGAWNRTSAWGGADGSIALNPSELARAENRGLQDIVAQTLVWYDAWHSRGVGMADLIQFSAIVATVTCPLGPRIKFFAGRPDDARAAPDGLLPSVDGTAPALIDLFQAKTFSPADLVALLGAHSTSQQFFADPAQAGAPQDSTPGVWDTKFYAETAARTAPKGVYRFPSDVALATYQGTSATWQHMSSQFAWDGAYANAYFRLSLLGVNNINDLVDCSESVP